MLFMDKGIQHLQVQPAKVVDTIIKNFVDVLTSGRGVGEGNW